MNRTADGRIASKKEAQRTDVKEMISRYTADAKLALKAGNSEAAKNLASKCRELRDLWFVEHKEAV